MRWRVQLGINSTSDVWKFCQNWTSRWGESNLANFQTYDVVISMTTSYSLANWPVLPIWQISKHDVVISMTTSYSLANWPVLPDYQPKFGAFVRIFI
jgi:hypothetical protein